MEVPITTQQDWQLKDLAAAEAAHTLPPHLPAAMVRVLLARGISTEEQFQLFLSPAHRLPHEPLRLNGMDAALRRLFKAMEPGSGSL